MRNCLLQLLLLLLLQLEKSMDEAALATAVQGTARTAAAEQLLQQALTSLIERDFIKRDDEKQ